jgi:hypothetical protein
MHGFGMKWDQSKVYKKSSTLTFFTKLLALEMSDDAYNGRLWRLMYRQLRDFLAEEGPASVWIKLLLFKDPVTVDCVAVVRARHTGWSQMRRLSIRLFSHDLVSAEFAFGV